MSSQQLSIQIRRITACGPQVPVKNYDKDGNAALGPKLNVEGVQLFKIPVNLYLEIGGTINASIQTAGQISNPVLDGDDLEVSGLTMSFYGGKSGGTGVSFRAEKITSLGLPASPASSAQKPSSPNSAA